MADISKYTTVSEAAKGLDVQYYTLIRWIQRDVGQIQTRGLVIKKSSWLLHKDAVEVLQGLIDRGVIHSRGNT